MPIVQNMAYSALVYQLDDLNLNYEMDFYTGVATIYIPFKAFSQEFIIQDKKFIDFLKKDEIIHKIHDITPYYLSKFLSIASDAQLKTKSTYINIFKEIFKIKKDIFEKFIFDLIPNISEIIFDFVDLTPMKEFIKDLLFFFENIQKNSSPLFDFWVDAILSYYDMWKKKK